MPVIVDPRFEGATAQAPQRLIEPQAPPEAPMLDVLAAASRQATLAGSAYERLIANPDPSDAGVPADYDPLDDIEGYEEHAEKFVDAVTPADVAGIKARIASEQRDRETLARAGLGGPVAEIGLNLLDPTFLVSIAVPELALAKSGRVGRAVQAALEGAAAGTAYEAGVRATQELRSPVESAFSIGGGALFSGILGAAIGRRVPAGEREQVIASMTREIRSLERPVGSTVPGERTSAPGAAAAAAPRDEIRRAAYSVKAALERAPDINVNDLRQVRKLAGDNVESISVYVKRTGGIADEGGELAARDITTKTAPGLVRRDLGEGGKAGTDAVRERVFEAGYFPEKADYNEISDSELFDAIAADVTGRRFWPGHVREKLAEADYARDLTDYWGERGITRTSSVEEIDRVLRDMDDEARALALSDEEIVADREAFDEFMASLGIDEPVESTGGAAAVRSTTMAQESLERGGEAIARSLGRISPGERLLTSPSLEARRLAQELVETPEALAKNREGIATPLAAETSLKRLVGDWWRAYRERGVLYGEYRKRVKGVGERPLSRKQFSEEVAFAMRRGDTHAIPEVQSAAVRTRATVFEPLKRRAQKAGLLPEDLTVTGAESYLMRQYNAAKIRREMRAWMETLADGFARQGVDRAEAVSIAHQVTRNILGSERGTLDLRALDGVVPQSGRLKERSLRLPDELLERFLVNDVDALSLAYLRTLGPEVELVERFGDRELKEAFDRIKDEYGVRKARAMAQGNDRALKGLTAREEADLRDLAAIRDRLYGHYGAPKDPGSFFVRAGRVVRAVNYMRLLGGQVISAMTDVARMVMLYGAPRMAASAAQLATSLKALKIARLEARRMAVGLDMVLNTRGIALGDIGEYSTFAEQAVMRRASDLFSIASLQSPWNALMKSWASVMSQDDILRAASAIASGRTISKTVRTRLASAGLDEPMLRRIGEQHATLGGTVQGLRFGNSSGWIDQEAARAFEGAVLKEADIAILTPSAGDLPLVYSTEWGKALLQLKSFAISSTRRLVVPMAQGLARGDVRTITAIPVLFGTGALVYVLKQLAADQPITTDPTRFVLEMVDRSGVLAWGGDVFFPAMWQVGSDDLSRWSDRQPVETLLGPALGAVGDAYASRWPARFLDGEISEVDLHKMRRLLPGQNLFYARRAINALEQEFAE